MDEHQSGNLAYKRSCFFVRYATLSARPSFATSVLARVCGRARVAPWTWRGCRRRSVKGILAFIAFFACTVLA
jgi:hypothetical protein